MEITEMYDMLLELQDRAEIEESEELSALREENANLKAQLSAVEKRFEESSIIWLTGKNYYLISDKFKKPKPGESVRYQIVREVPE